MEPWAVLLRDRVFAGALAGLMVLAAVAGVASRADSAAESTESAPTATATLARPTGTPTATPTQGEIVQDSRRRLDLARNAEALELYHKQRGSYPSTTDEFQTFCSKQWDAGCQVLSVTSDISGSDGETPYWYRSDGASYAMFAPSQTPPDGDACPNELPPALADEPVFCLIGGRP